MTTFDLTVTVDADVWAYAQRRLTYLEAMLIRIDRERWAIQEWMSAAELDAKRLPGLPAGKAAIARKATAEHWMKRKVQGERRWHFAYHVSSLPDRTFDALIGRVLDLPPIDAIVPAMVGLPDAPPLPERVPENTAPPWVLPLMRILRSEDAPTLGEAWDMLPDYLPPGVVLPDVEEAARVMIRFGIASRV